MRNDDRHTTPTGHALSRPYLRIGALVALVIVCTIIYVVARDGDIASYSTDSLPASEATIASTATTAPDYKSVVVARLREILDIREQAFRERDATLFDDVYTSDCSCLRAGREAIAALRRENIRWRGRSISVDVQSATNLNQNLWEVVALYLSDSFRIETETGSLVREAPAERLRYRFLLVRVAGSWRLGNASLAEGE